MGIVPVMAIAGLLMLMNPKAEPLTKKQKQAQAAYLFIHGLDWAQTRTIAKSDGEFIERNPILGRHPNTSQVDKYFLSTALLHAGITKTLPKKYRRFWLGASVAIEGGVVNHNIRMGVKFDF